jgi:hypothetical protein
MPSSAGGAAPIDNARLVLVVAAAELDVEVWRAKASLRCIDSRQPTRSQKLRRASISVPLPNSHLCG